MRKPELASAIADAANISKEKAGEVINAFTDEIMNSLAENKSVTLIGFGTFSQRSRSQRQGKNPKTGEAITIPASKSVGFKPGKTLKDAVN
ncbi:MAG: HU family DNA-binding protein [Hahellaceae bacterium]|jgi:DNA-binding protein HU-alpha|nr:HU family DNA-binding protein [Hahellaceae bacterium]MCP5210200.1 HU family DNA-binding protein [Hahellaceae bacterium]